MSQNIKFSGPRRQNGFTIIEVLITAVIVCIGILGIGAAVVHLNSTNQKQELIASGLAIDNMITSAIMDSSTYTNFQTALNASKQTLPITDGNGVKLQLKMPLQNTGDRRALASTLDCNSSPDSACWNVVPEFGPNDIPHVNYVDNLGQPCYLSASTGSVQASYTFPGPHCSHAFRVSMNTGTVNGGWTFAKRTISNDGTSAAIMQDPLLTAASLQGYKFSSSNPNDYTMTIPDQFYSTGVTNHDKCDPTQSPVGSVWGAQSVGGNLIGSSVTCIRRTAADVTCPANAISLGVKFAIQPDGSYEFVPNCVAVAKWTCPVNYRLQSFQPPALLPNQDGSFNTSNPPQCLLVTQPSVTNQTLTANKIDGKLCPDNYTIVGFSCTANGTPKTGTAPCQKYTYTWDPPKVVSGIEIHDQQYGPKANYNAATPPVAGYADFHVVSPGNVIAFCEAVVPPQICGNSWSATVTATFGCQSSLPIQTPAPTPSPF